MKIQKFKIALVLMLASSFTYCKEPKEKITEGLAQPESVLYHSQSKTLFVANINGQPSTKDDNGFIQVFSAKGKLLKNHFIDGKNNDYELHAPKGMAISEEVLWVADIDSVRKFHIKTGQSLGSIEIEGATFINDITALEDGSVLVTDTGLLSDFSNSGTDAIYRIYKDGKIKIITPIRKTQKQENSKEKSLISQEELYAKQNPNGIIKIAQDRFIFVSYNKSGYVLTADLNGNVLDLKTLPYSGLDGIILTKENQLIITSWSLKGVFLLDKDTGKTKVIRSGLESPADLGYSPHHNLLYIPSISKNEITVIKL